MTIMKRISRSRTLYAEVDEDGSVNGQSLGAFLQSMIRNYLVD